MKRQLDQLFRDTINDGQHSVYESTNLVPNPLCWANDRQLPIYGLYLLYRSSIYVKKPTITNINEFKTDKK